MTPLHAVEQRAEECTGLLSGRAAAKSAGMITSCVMSAMTRVTQMGSQPLLPVTATVVSNVTLLGAAAIACPALRLAKRRGMAGPLNLLGHVLADGPEGGLISVPISIRHPEGPPIAFMSIRPMSSTRAPST